MGGPVKHLFGKPRVTSVIAAVVIAVGLIVLVNDGSDPAGDSTDAASSARTTVKPTSQPTQTSGPEETGPDDSTARARATATTLSPNPQQEIPREHLAPGGGGKAATDLSAVPSCTPERGGTARLRWSRAAERGEVQRVAVTQYADGFETQRFSLSPDLSADAEAYDWPGGLEPGIQYRWEVLTRHGDTFTRSATATFRGADCLADS